MKKVPIKDLVPGMQLGEDLYREGDRLKRTPLFSYGIFLTERSVEQIKRFFPSTRFVKIIDGELSIEERRDDSVVGKSVPQFPVNKRTMLTKPIPYEELLSGNFSRLSAVEMFEDSILQSKIYKNTKKKIKKYISNVNSILEAFINTGKLNENFVMETAQSITSDILEGNNFFDLSLVYLVELEEWDKITFNHSFDVGVLTLFSASFMSDQYEELTSLFIGGLLHDVGKFIYSKYKLNDMDYLVKKPDKLTREELEQVKRHVAMEQYIKDWFPNLPNRLRENIIYGILEHHERFDGSGYLRGKKGQNISFSGRLIAICDVYDALVRRRSYKTLLTPSQAMAVLLKMEKEGMFDRSLFQYFYKAMGRFPNAGVVNTNRGIAVVSNQNPNDPERPYLIFPESTEEVNTYNEVDIEIFDL